MSPAGNREKSPERRKDAVHSNKLLGVEILRFLSAFAVLMWHYQNFSYVANLPVNFVREAQPFYSFLKMFYEYGGGGVKVFWCISGFIFFWKYRSLIADGLVSGRKFFVLRFSRLYPLHLVTLFLVAVLQLVHHRINGHFFFTYIVDLPYFISQLFMASGWGYPNPSSFNGPIWSISVEVLVYFAFFLMLKYLSRSALVNIAIIALCVVAHRLKITHGSVDCLAFFYIGGLSAIACQDIKSLLLRKSLDILGWLAFFLVPLAVWRFQLYQHKYFEYLFLFLYSPVVLFCVSKEFRVGPVAQKVIEAFGNMTYSSYLLQFPVELAIVTALSAAKLSAPLYDPRFFLAYLGFVLTASYLTYRNFEAPMQRWLRKSLKSGGSKGIMPA